MDEVFVTILFELIMISFMFLLFKALSYMEVGKLNNLEKFHELLKVEGRIINVLIDLSR